MPRDARVDVSLSGDVRKLVTVLFCDLVDSTAMAGVADPELVRNVVQGYFELASRMIQRHGGTQEKFIGDAVMAVFGHPQQREDDALRALRAAIAVRDSVKAYSEQATARLGLPLSVRIGVDTGQVVAGDVSTRDTFVTGDAVNVAARLEQAAAPGEVLIGRATYALTRHAIAAEATEQPLQLKGKGPTPAWRLLRVSSRGGDVAPSQGSALVGRGRELALLHEAFERAQADGGRMLTVLGTAGIGKSRLVDEFFAGIAASAAVLRAGCPSYGTDITFRPVLEIMGQAARLHGITTQAEAATALSARLEPAGDGAAVVDHLAPLLQSSQSAVAKEDIFWAFRRLLEALARAGPLVVGVDDVHRAAPTLLDLLEYVAQWSRAPILLLCVARPDLLELRPGWGAAAPGSSSVLLQPLGPDDGRRLVEASGIDEALAARLVAAAEGNPLFLEQLLAHALEDPGPRADLQIPPTIQALIGARLDQLPPRERHVLGHAAVVGGDFDVETLADLDPGAAGAELREILEALMRRELIRRGAREYGFWHGLIREVAYESLPKQVRAELHERLARALDRDRPGDLRAGQLELAGYHLEHAYRYRTELGRMGEHERELAAAAAMRLDAAGAAAVARDDLPAATGLLERAVALPSPEQAEYRYRLGAARFAAGRLADADQALAEAIAAAADSRDAALEARARVEQQFVRLQTAAEGRMEAARRVARDALAVCAAAGDELGQCRAHMLRAWIEWIAGRVAAAEEAWRSAEVHARRGGEQRRLFEIQGWLAGAAVWGPTEVPAGILRCERLLGEVAANRVVEALTRSPLAALHAMRGDFDRARTLLREASEVLGEVAMLDTAVSHYEAMVDMLRGDARAAETRLRAAYARLQGMDERAFRSTTAAMLGQAVHAQGRENEAEALASESAELAAPEDASTQVVWRGLRARILAGRGEIAEGEALARAAVELVGRTDWPTLHGDALMDLGAVLVLGGRRGEAAAAIASALDLYERKGNLISAARARAALAELRE